MFNFNKYALKGPVSRAAFCYKWLGSQTENNLIKKLTSRELNFLQKSMVKSQEKTVKLGTICLKRVCHFFKKLFSAFEEGATELDLIFVTIK